MRHDNNPCMGCPEAGCGKHAECEQYLEYFNANREEYKRRREKSEMDGYTVEAIRKAKKCTRSSTSRYRPKGRW